MSEREVKVPEGILCTNTHEWILEDGDIVVSGLTDYAIEQLGDIVFIELPEVGSKFGKNEVFATIESVKAASEIYMPVGGEIVEINEDLINSPEIINESPYENGLLVKIKCDNLQDDSVGLLEYEDYKEEIE